MENKKFSIKNKDNKIKKKNADIDKVYKKTKGAKLYLGTLMGFLVVTMMICFSPFVVGKTYDYTTVELNKPITITSSLALRVADMEFNSDTGLFKMVITYKDETNAKSLSNLKYNYNLNYIENKGKSNATKKVVKVEDDYAVVYYENLPKDFGVLSIKVNPRYIYPDLESTNDLKDKEIKFYAVQKNIKKNSNLKIEDKSELRRDSINYQITQIKDNIEKENKNINVCNTAIKVMEKDIKKLEKDLDFQTMEEQVETQNNISNKKNQIKLKKEEIEKSKTTIKDYKDKIEKLKGNLTSFK
ncbi:hypothetical protein HYH68_16310 [Clostridium botulinum]|uniref:hypothetical protein n=1 Tax=Clostridium botulinum TaxID=1491 RepID=UPI001C9ABB68|nr:hypothetical protein [Clostridium botulinum]MBY6889356.1 hypothetical protein [Clostridium botulinum]